jgi:hypothetical protein
MVFLNAALLLLANSVGPVRAAAIASAESVLLKIIMARLAARIGPMDLHMATSLVWDRHNDGQGLIAMLSTDTTLRQTVVLTSLFFELASGT